MSDEPPLTDPALYLQPTLQCDLIMKGGITSGVVYPLAICELARTYELRSLGGASAGAIAAAGAAAAELGRRLGAPGTGFAGLASLPQDISRPIRPGGPSRLQSLFQPAPSTEPLFDLLLGCLSAGRLGKLLRVLETLTRLAPGPVLGGILLAVACFWAGTRTEGAARWLLSVGALLALLVGGAVAAVLAVLEAADRIARNGYGLCWGGDEHASAPALSSWLHALFQRLSGKLPEEPLTFGDLRRRDITLRVMTTSLTHGRPYRLPLETQGLFGSDPHFYFRDDDLARLFPPPVVSHVRSCSSRRAQAGVSVPDGFVLFPEPDELPVLVAVRMSLSFPVLLSAVPLYTVDWSLERNYQGRTPPVLERCWFSDGGICSNLPIHFFDSLVPARPTFALNLRGEHPDHPVEPDDPAKNTWVPTGNAAGLNEWWNRFDARPGRLALVRFLGSIVSTMQGWGDQVQMRMPGFRDRIVHISHTEMEGGLNLDMPPPVIAALGQRGRAAAVKLQARFRWDNHVWVRYRNFFFLLEEGLEGFAHGYGKGKAGRQALEAMILNPPSYPMDASQQRLALAWNRALDWMSHRRGPAGPAASPTPLRFGQRTPRPVAELRTRPRT